MRSPEWSGDGGSYLEDLAGSAAAAEGGGEDQRLLTAKLQEDGRPTIMARHRYAADETAGLLADQGGRRSGHPSRPGTDLEHNGGHGSKDHQQEDRYLLHENAAATHQHDEEDSRYYTYSSDDGDGDEDEAPTTPPELLEGERGPPPDNGRDDDGGQKNRRQRRSSAAAMKTPRNAPISTAVTPSEERRRRDSAERRRAVQELEHEVGVNYDNGGGAVGRGTLDTSTQARRSPGSNAANTSSTNSGSRSSGSLSSPNSKRRRRRERRSHRHEAAAASARDREPRPSIEETSTSGTSHDAYFDQGVDPHSAWTAAFSAQQQQQQQHQQQHLHRGMRQPYQQQHQPFPYYQQQDERHQDWPAAFQDARYRGTGYEEATTAAAAGAAAAAGYGAYHGQQQRQHHSHTDYGSLVHPLATPDSSVASGDQALSPPSLTLPSPRLLPRKSADESSPEMEHHIPNLKSPATMETAGTVPTSSTYLSRVEEGPAGRNGKGEKDDDSSDDDEEADEEVGLLPDNLKTTYHTGRATVAGTAYLQHPTSPLSMITTDTGEDESLSPPQDRSRQGRRGRNVRRSERNKQQSSSLMPPHYVTRDGTKSSYGSTSLSHPREQELYQGASHEVSLSKSGSHVSVPSTAHMSKKSLRRHRRKKEEAEARERAVRAIRGAEQPPSAASSDRIWGILFLLQLIAVVTVGFTLGPNAVMTSGGSTAVASNSSSGRLIVKTTEDNPSLFDDDMVISKTVPSTDDYTYLVPPELNGPTSPDDSPSSEKPTQDADASNGTSSTSSESTTTDTSGPGNTVEIITDTISDGWFKIQVDYRNALQICCITGLYAAALTSLTIGFMMILAKSLIQTALIFTILVCFAWGTVGIVLSPYSFVPILGFIALALSLGYSVVVWDSIPFHATNLSTALTGVRCVADTLLLGFFMLVIAFFWCIIWGFAFIGTYDFVSDGGESKPWLAGTDGALLGLMVISMFWTYNVFTGIIQAVVAGSIGNWWYDPDSVNACCSNATRAPLIRALTSSFGSICFGSLFVQPIQFFKNIIAVCCFSAPQNARQYKSSRSGGKSSSKEQGRRRRDRPAPEPVSGSPCAKMRRHFLRALDSLCKIFNHWAFVYIGLYNYNFWDSGKKATTLFNTRGWSGIVSNGVVRNVLFMTSVVIGLCTGLFGLIVEEFDGYEFTSFNKPTATAFVIGSLIGCALSGIMLSVLGSATNAVLVCFAAGNVEFSRIHPQLSNEMKESWATVWSGYFVD